MLRWPFSSLLPELFVEVAFVSASLKPVWCGRSAASFPGVRLLSALGRNPGGQTEFDPGT